MATSISLKMFEVQLAKHVERKKLEIINAAIEEIRKELIKAASQMSVGIKEHYSVATLEDNIVITLQLPK